VVLKPSCLISCSHWLPDGSLSVLVGRHGAMNPAALGKPGRPRSGASRWHPARRPLGGGFSGLGRLIDLHEAAVLHIVNVAVDRDVLRHQRMITDAHNVVNHASREVADCMPFDELAIDRARALADVAPAGFAKLCSVEAFRQSPITWSVNVSMPQLV